MEAKLGYANESKSGRPPNDFVELFEILILVAQSTEDDQRTAILVCDPVDLAAVPRLRTRPRPIATPLGHSASGLTHAGAIDALSATYDRALCPAGYVPMSSRTVGTTLAPSPWQRKTGAGALANAAVLRRNL